MIRSRFALTYALVAALALPAHRAATSINWYSPAELYCSKLPRERTCKALKRLPRKFRRWGPR